MTADVAPARRRGDRLSRWVSFWLGGQSYGIDILQVQEVLARAEIEPVPRAPADVLGVINLRGSIVTVVDLRARLGLPAADGGVVVIADVAGQAVGLRVDRVAEVLNIPEHAIKPAPNTGAGLAATRVRGVVPRQQDLLTLLDVSALLGLEPAAA
ncbi:MAG: chemotaxis protein CheW [Nevskiaceae bacterium]|nr:MAG: chemotaxis protein CheW [Nevskiaceae bacterium]